MLDVVQKMQLGHNRVDIPLPLKNQWVL